MIDIQEISDKWDKFFDSEEGIRSLEEYAQKLDREDARRLNNVSRIKKLFNNNKEFDTLMERILSKHDERWDELCYNRGYEPIEWSLLSTIRTLMVKEGKEIEAVDSLTEDFPSSVYSYRGWQTAITHGQGSAFTVYKNKKRRY